MRWLAALCVDVGLLMFGLVAQWAGESHLSVFFLVAFFLIGMALLAKLDVGKKRRVALEAEAELAAGRAG